MEEGMKKATQNIQALLINEAKKQAKAEAYKEVLDIVEEMEDKYEDHSKQYREYRDEYLAAANACEAIRLRIQQLGGSDD